MYFCIIHSAVLQHVSHARVKPDTKDLQTVIECLKERNPFSRSSKDLHSLSSGIIGEGSVNIDSAKEVGESILVTMEGKSVSQHKFVEKQVINLTSSTYMTLNTEKIEINPQQLYQ